MNRIFSLLRYLVQREFRDAHQLWSLFLFALTSAYACYRIAGGQVDANTWVALHWVVVLFSAFNAAARTHADDAPEIRAWMRSWVSPHEWALARMVHATGVLLGVTAAVFGAFALFMPTRFLAEGTALWLVGMAATAWALAALLAVVADIAQRAGGGFGLTAVLGLPLVVPVAMVSTQYCHGVVDQMPWEILWPDLVFLVVLAGVAHVIAAVVFPYLWQE